MPRKQTGFALRGAYGRESTHLRLEFSPGELTFSVRAHACIHFFLQPSHLTAAVMALRRTGVCSAIPGALSHAGCPLGSM